MSRSEFFREHMNRSYKPLVHEHILLTRDIIVVWLDSNNFRMEPLFSGNHFVGHKYRSNVVVLGVIPQWLSIELSWPGYPRELHVGVTLEMISHFEHGRREFLEMVFFNRLDISFSSSFCTMGFIIYPGGDAHKYVQRRMPGRSSAEVGPREKRELSSGRELDTLSGALRIIADYFTAENLCSK
jgi:hypothetical protein